MLPISFEYFPPKTEKGMQNLISCAQQLACQQPHYSSVTFGAGGASQIRTPETVQTLLKADVSPIAPHISCVGNSPTQLRTLLDGYQNLGIKHLVVLRGDCPVNEPPITNAFSYANELVTFIRQHFGSLFHIKVACYPECHPDADNLEQDFHYFAQKVRAGANEAITQYFYNADSYSRLRERCQKSNINIPITPGIMPITNFANVQRFSKQCGAEIPRWLEKDMAGLTNPEDIRRFGLDVVTQLTERLIKAGAPALHFYTLNKATECEEILARLSLGKACQHAD